MEFGRRYSGRKRPCGGFGPHKWRAGRAVLSSTHNSDRTRGNTGWLCNEEGRGEPLGKNEAPICCCSGQNIRTMLGARAEKH